MTFPGGTHDLWMRYWLSANGVDPVSEADLVVVPPAQMVANLQTGTMDTFCVGEPWNQRTVNKKIGYTGAITGELWKDPSGEGLLDAGRLGRKNPKATKAMLMAVQEAQIWCQDPANFDECVRSPPRQILQILSQTSSPVWLAPSISGMAAASPIHP